MPAPECQGKLVSPAPRLRCCTRVPSALRAGTLARCTRRVGPEARSLRGDLPSEWSDRSMASSTRRGSSRKRASRRMAPASKASLSSSTCSGECTPFTYPRPSAPLLLPYTAAATKRLVSRLMILVVLRVAAQVQDFRRQVIRREMLLLRARRGRRCRSCAAPRVAGDACASAVCRTAHCRKLTCFGPPTPLVALR